MDGFHFGNLAEIRYFLKNIGNEQNSPVISEEKWNAAKKRTLEKYRESICADLLKEFFSIFEKTNSTKYRSDLADFVLESNLEDFCGEGKQTVFVSTIHKAKGREFDTVFMMLDNEHADTDERIRKLYVGMTRAKQKLYIHCNTNIFNTGYNSVKYVADVTKYPLPEEITLQLTFHDVYLNFFKDKKERILRMHSGTPLLYNDGYLYNCSSEKVAFLSKQAFSKLKEWENKGYAVRSAKANYIVAWKGQGEENETAVLLPELVLAKTTDDRP